VMGEVPLSEEEAMNMAILEARKGIGFVAPNPPVGCVILDKNGFLIGKGFHTRYGAPHAEVEAIRSVRDSERLKEASVFVTLEPCGHFGKTPPCADQLAELPLRKVVFGMKDPNPMVAGQGIAKIRQFGIHVEEWTGPYGLELAELVEVFLVNILERRAFVGMKAAITLDGFVADRSGRVKWITNAKSREAVHYLRGCYQAVLVGNGTIKSDNPQLNVRSEWFGEKPNKVVVLDPDMRLGSNLEIYRFSHSHSPSDIIQVVSKSSSSPPSDGHNEMLVNLEDSKIDLNDLSRRLFEKGICSVFVEGGASTFSNYLVQRAVDRMYLFLAPKILGYPSGLSWTCGLTGQELDQCPELDSPRITEYDGDVLISGRLKFR
jgi:diaminohydroxyphosphoribosylaminopyrimidine deaminase/5-amino-6-(5-phosphoribosylamino)uracil reductase